MYFVQGKPPPATLPDADLGRMLVCHFTGLVRGAAALPPTERRVAEAHIITLHTALKAACPKYAADACFAEVPLPPPAETAPAPAPGTVLVQWYPQDGCWQAEASWGAGGSLAGSGGAVSDSEVLALRPPEAWASMLYTIVPPGAGGTASAVGARTGELTFEVSAVRALARRVKELRHRCESPKAPTDLFGADAPSPSELASVRAAAERFLGKRRLSDDGASSTHSGAPPATPPLATGTEAPPRPSSPGPPAPAAPVSSSGAKAGGKGGKDAGAAAAAAAAAQVPAGPIPTDLAFLTKLEALLCVENGVELSDPGFADWLASTLPPE